MPAPKTRSKNPQTPKKTTTKPSAKKASSTTVPVKKKATTAVLAKKKATTTSSNVTQSYANGSQQITLNFAAGKSLY